MNINGIPVGSGSPCFVIAEAGVNHNGDLSRAKLMIDAAVDAGANAIKFQSFKARQLVTDTAEKAGYQKEATGGGETQLEMLEKLELSKSAHRQLKDHSDAKGITFLSTPFDEESAELLVDLGVGALKVSSGDLTNLPFLEFLASKRLPLIISTGMATIEEVKAALEAVSDLSSEPPVVLHCVSSYPADPRDANLRAMVAMGNTFGIDVGYSDHTLGVEVALAAVALGACVIEKHFTLSRSLPGPDHRASIEPEGLAHLVDGIRVVEQALGSGRKAPTIGELDTSKAARRSVTAATDIPAGAVITRDMLEIRRPGTGIPPSALGAVVGKRATTSLSSGAVLRWDDVR